MIINIFVYVTIDAYEKYMNPLAAIATAQHSSGIFVGLLVLTYCTVC